MTRADDGVVSDQQTDPDDGRRQQYPDAPIAVSSQHDHRPCPKLIQYHLDAMASCSTSSIQIRAPGLRLSASLKRPWSSPASSSSSVPRNFATDRSSTSSTAGRCARHSKATGTKLISRDPRADVSLLRCKARPSPEQGSLPDDGETPVQPRITFSASNHLPCPLANGYSRP